MGSGAAHAAGHENWRRERVVGDGGGSGAASRVRADRQRQPGLLRRRSTRRRQVGELDRRAAIADRRARVGLSARPPRSLGLRRAGGADACRREAERPHGSRRRADHQDGSAVHLRSRDGAADLRHGRASRAAEHSSRRIELADATLSTQARSAGAQHLRSRQGLLHADAGACRVLQGALGRQRDVHQGPVHAPAWTARW